MKSIFGKGHMRSFLPGIYSLVCRSTLVTVVQVYLIVYGISTTNTLVTCSRVGEIDLPLGNLQKAPISQKASHFAHR